MSKLVGMKWGSLKKETQDYLLRGAYCIDGETCNAIEEGECIIDLTSSLSISGKVVDSEIEINCNAIIYNPSEGIILKAKEEAIFDIDEVMTVNEAAETWGKTEGAIRDAIKRKKFIVGIDYRKAGRITLISRKSMENVYGEI